MESITLELPRGSMGWYSLSSLISINATCATCCWLTSAMWLPSSIRCCLGGSSNLVRYNKTYTFANMSFNFHLPNLVFDIIVPKTQTATLVSTSPPNETKAGCTFPPQTPSSWYGLNEVTFHTSFSKPSHPFKRNSKMEISSPLGILIRVSSGWYDDEVPFCPRIQGLSSFCMCFEAS